MYCPTCKKDVEVTLTRQPVNTRLARIITSCGECTETLASEDHRTDHRGPISGQSNF